MFIMLCLASKRATATETLRLQLSQIGDQQTAFNSTDEKKRGNDGPSSCFCQLYQSVIWTVASSIFTPGAIVLFYSKQGNPFIDMLPSKPSVQ